MKSRYLFYFCDGIGSVFDSQVLTLLNSINDKDVFSKVYLFLGISSEEQKNKYLKIKSSAGIKIVPFKSYPNYPVFNYLNRKSIKAALSLQSIDLNEVIFHTRGELTAWHLSSILESRYHKHIIPDIRGASIEEIEEFYDMNKLQKFVKTYNNKMALQNLNRFVKMSVVSGSLKEYLVNNYSVNPEKIFITPSLAGKDFTFNEQLRKKVRNELNLNEKDLLIVFSSGGTANWQNNDSLTWLADKGFKVLNLSKKEIRHTNIINKFVSYSEMPEYLNAADCAIIWRDKSIVNEVASPVKFSEYICCGLPVISNASVNLIKDYLEKEDYGLIINSLDELNLIKLQKLKLNDRNSTSQRGILKFGVDAITTSYLTIYSSISNL
ncbi:MAG TPA: glycosyltransferase [Ignavibacteriaceae bacterium]|nr:glycosyltransferase [Ignavibacteriaceae bacterium]